jgi:ASC-1-like (ASCH) protein
LIKFEFEELPGDPKEVQLYDAIKQALQPEEFEEALNTFSLVKRAIRGYKTYVSDTY